MPGSLRPSLTGSAAGDQDGQLLLAWGELDGVTNEADVSHGEVGAIVGPDAGGVLAGGGADQVVVDVVAGEQ
jgi:hypothetical protein